MQTFPFLGQLNKKGTAYLEKSTFKSRLNFILTTPQENNIRAYFTVFDEDVPKVERFEIGDWIYLEFTPISRRTFNEERYATILKVVRLYRVIDKEKKTDEPAYTLECLLKQFITDIIYVHRQTYALRDPKLRIYKDKVINTLIEFARHSGLLNVNEIKDLIRKLPEIKLLKENDDEFKFPPIY